MMTMVQKTHDTLWEQLCWDLARLKTLAPEAERGDSDARQEFYEFQDAMQAEGGAGGRDDEEQKAWGTVGTGEKCRGCQRRDRFYCGH